MVPLVRRIDAGSLRRLREVSGGGIRVDALLTRTGVFEYLNPDGSVRREYRPPDEVFHQDSMYSAECIPVGDDHPEELISLKDEKKYRLGLTGEQVRRDGEWLTNSIVVRDPKLIAKMRRGKVFVSCGYECDLEDRSGISPDGERYDCIQRNIRYNHVAIVDVPRAGAQARVRMDEARMIRRADGSPDQPRDEQGRFGEGGGGAASDKKGNGGGPFAARASASKRAGPAGKAAEKAYASAYAKHNEAFQKDKDRGKFNDAVKASAAERDKAIAVANGDEDSDEDKGGGDDKPQKGGDGPFAERAASIKASGPAGKAIEKAYASKFSKLNEAFQKDKDRDKFNAGLKEAIHERDSQHSSAKKSKKDAKETTMPKPSEMNDEDEQDEENGVDDEDVEREDDDEVPAFLKKKGKKDAADFVDRASFDRMQARADSLEAENRDLRKKLKTAVKRTDASDITSRVRERVALIGKAGPVLRLDGEDVDLIEESDRDIMVAVVARVDNANISDAKKYSDDYVRARFDSAIERTIGTEDALIETVELRMDNMNADLEVASQQRMRDRTSKRWQDSKKGDN